MRPPPPPTSAAVALPAPVPWPMRDVYLDQVQPRVGERRFELTISYSFRGGDQPFGLVFYWPRPVPITVAPSARPFLRLEASHGPPHSAPDKHKPFAGRAELDAIAAAFNRAPLPQSADKRAGYEYLVANVPGMADIKVRFILDTDDDDYIKFANAHLKEKPDQPFTLEVKAYLFDLQHRDARVETIKLQMVSPHMPGWDEGLLAIDLGHNTTSLTWMPQLGDRTSSLQVLDARGSLDGLGHLGRIGSPVTSNLQLTHVSATHKPFRLNRCRWRVGVSSEGGETANNIFFSVKRLLAERDPQPGQPPPVRRVTAYQSLTPRDQEAPSEVEIPARLPAELFLCRMFQRHREALCRSPRCFAVTYPTTFSVREVTRTREAAYRAWLRCMDQPQSEHPIDFDDEDVQKRFPLALDEASAAGYFILHRLAFERPHGLNRFRYLYPDGMNLLLFDCGGGTIDIGLLTAFILPAEPASELPTGLDVRVIGRSGKRSFGGDNITEAVFKLLKAQLAMALMATTGEKMQLPDRPDALARFLEDNAKKFDDKLPTRFDPERATDEATKRRRALTRNLWAIAENLKHELGGNPRVAYKHTQGDLLDQQLKRLLPAGGQQQAFDTQLKKIEIRREHLDALIGAEILDSIERCNHLIYQKLTQAGREVDYVAVLGNGARYPLFLELMRERLAVPFLDERLIKVKESGSATPERDETLEVEEADLKNAVAKGAVLALWSRQAANNVRIEFDRSLSELVPFTLAYKDLKNRHFLPLLKEHQRYDSLSNGSPELDVYRQPGMETTVLLYRHWPGDMEADGKERFWPYLVYRFSEPLRGGITVRFDRDTHAFVVSSGAEEATLVMELIEDVEESRLWKILASPDPQKELRKINYAPIQRGEL